MTETSARTAGRGTARRRVALDHERLEEVKRLVHEGWVDQLLVRDRRGRVIVQVPLLIGLTTAVVAPIWTVLGAIAGLAAGCTIDIDLREDAPLPREWPREPPPDVDVDREEIR